jgi:hypothetical protein
MRSVVMLLVALSFSSLSAWSQPISRPAGDGRIEGRVLTEAGSPLAGVVVYVVLPATIPTQPPARFRATTGADGGYVLEHLPPGRLLLGAEKPGYANPLQPGPIEGATVVNLESGGTVAGIDLVVRRTAWVAGRVTRPDRTPIANVQVVLEKPQPNGPIGTSVGARTDADGRYWLGGVPPGTYVITAIYSVLDETMGRPVPDDHQDGRGRFIRRPPTSSTPLRSRSAAANGWTT